MADAVQQARDLIASQEYNAAILLLEGLRESIGDDASLLEALGEVYRAMQLWDEAARFYRRAVEARPNSAGAWAGLGIVHFEQEHPDSAETALHRALLLDPKQTDAMGYLGEIALEGGDYRSAADYFQKILDLEGETFDALTDLGAVYQRSGDWKGARPYFERAAKLYPDNPTAHYNMAVLEAQTGEFHGAVLQANKALELDPDNLDTLRFLGILYFENQVCAEAVRYFERVLTLVPMDQEVRIALATCLHSLGKTDRAVLELKTLMNHAGEDYDLLLLIADFRLEQDRLDDALQSALRALALDSKRPDAHYLLGLTYRRMGLEDQAVHEFELLDKLREEERLDYGSSKEPEAEGKPQLEPITPLRPER